jgi:hypothetical protein
MDIISQSNPGISKCLYQSDGLHQRIVTVTTVKLTFVPSLLPSSWHVHQSRKQREIETQQPVLLPEQSSVLSSSKQKMESWLNFPQFISPFKTGCQKKFVPNGFQCLLQNVGRIRGHIHDIRNPRVPDWRKHDKDHSEPKHLKLRAGMSFSPN